jgi:hypothetical protein
VSAKDPEQSEAELRAAYEQEIRRIRVEHVLLENVVTLINLGMRRTGLMPGTESERDAEQVRLAIEAVRTLLPIVKPVAADQAGALEDALSQLQLAYVQIGGAAEPTQGTGAGTEGTGQTGSGAGGGAGGAGTPGAGPAGPTQTGPGPAQRSGRLWVPGQ